LNSTPSESNPTIESTSPSVNTSIPVTYDAPQLFPSDVGDIDALPSVPATSLDGNDTLPEYSISAASAPPNNTSGNIHGGQPTAIPLKPLKFQSDVMSSLATSTAKPNKPVNKGKTVSFKLRKVEFYGEMLNKFMEIAYKNTVRNIETCAFLCGNLNSKDNTFVITTLVIPKQTGTSDTCQAVDEESIFAYQDAQQLLTIGWIHTHPGYEAFLSSIDLHTHCGYQSMLPESIAIVMAPRFQPSYQIFTLTEPYGLKTIQDCPHATGFHQHPKPPPPIYMPASHVSILKGNKFAVKDLR